MPNCHLRDCVLRRILSLCFLWISGQLASECRAQPIEAEKRYALLIAVNKYEDSKLNRPQLLFPESDAHEIGEVLQLGGYEVEKLIGKAATRDAILSKLEKMNQKGNDEGAVVLGFFGHGVEYSGTDEAMFCPYDTTMRFAKGSDGKQLFESDEFGGGELMEPDPASLIGMSAILRSLKICKAGNKLLLADCCRKSPNAARGRAFGSTISLSNLPDNTAALFACSKGEEAQEHPDWKHGAMTRSFLDLLPELAGDASDINAITGRMSKNVSKLVRDATNGSKKQTLNPIVKGIVELKLKKRVGPNTRSLNELPNEFANSIGIKLKRISAGEFSMGSNETNEGLSALGLPIHHLYSNKSAMPQHKVKISSPFFMGVHEVTLGQFLEFYKADPESHKTDAERDGKGSWAFDGKDWKEAPGFVAWHTSWNDPMEQFLDHPVVNVSWNDASRFCNWLTLKERQEGNIGLDQEYRLPSEAQWEYACRAGSSDLFFFGKNLNDSAKFCNIKDASFFAKYGNRLQQKSFGDDGFVHTSPVGSFLPNAFGLFDMHGNAMEWCEDSYDSDAYTSRSELTTDPVVRTDVPDHVFRGGSWWETPATTIAVYRNGKPKDFRIDSLGFRVALQTVK